mmetsp:Transcript_9206/g.13111  ORF Transcript_9206/g.13111 Transcript_9206/m.13111 type:complete len:221 (+) Transcript_9206:983-1645(+)
MLPPKTGDLELLKRSSGTPRAPGRKKTRAYFLLTTTMRSTSSGSNMKFRKSVHVTSRPLPFASSSNADRAAITNNNNAAKAPTFCGGCCCCESSFLLLPPEPPPPRNPPNGSSFFFLSFFLSVSFPLDSLLLSSFLPDFFLGTTFCPPLGKKFSKPFGTLTFCRSQSNGKTDEAGKLYGDVNDCCCCSDEEELFVRQTSSCENGIAITFASFDTRDDNSR